MTHTKNPRRLTFRFSNQSRVFWLCPPRPSLVLIEISGIISKLKNSYLSYFYQYLKSVLSKCLSRQKWMKFSKFPNFPPFPPPLVFSSFLVIILHFFDFATILNYYHITYLNLFYDLKGGSRVCPNFPSSRHHWFEIKLL